jgi:hypothetical protein
LQQRLSSSARDIAQWCAVSLKECALMNQPLELCAICAAVFINDSEAFARSGGMQFAAI